jgi:hypothetical protein
VVTSL